MIEGQSPIRTRACMNIANYVKSTSFLENHRRVPTYFFFFNFILFLNFTILY